MGEKDHYQYDALTSASVVGSGPLGATFAKILVNDGHTVLMVEAGAEESKKRGEHKKNAVRFQKDIDSFVHLIKGSLQLTSVPTDESVVHSGKLTAANREGKQVQHGQNPYQDPALNLGLNAVARNVGGMSTHWTCSTPRQHLRERSPLLQNEWERLYSEAEKLIETHTDVLEGSIRQDMVKQILNDHFEGEKDKNGDQKPAAFALPLAAKREGSEFITWSSSYTVLEKIKPEFSKKLELRSEWLCEKLTIIKNTKDASEDAGIVENAKVRSLLTNQLDEVKARVYIICGGPILTPQLLFNSGFWTGETTTKTKTWTKVGPNSVSHCVERLSDKEVVEPFLELPALGHYLTEQTMCFCQVVLDRRWIKAVYGAHPYPKDDPKNDGWDSLRKEKWDEKIKKHLETLKGCYPQDKLPFPFNDRDPQVTLPVSEKQPWHTQIHRDAFSYGAVPPNIDKRTIVDLRFFGPVEPTKDNCVKFTTKVKDAYGMPQPTFFYRLGDADRELTHQMMKHMEEVAGVLGGYLPGSEPQFMENGLALHVCGTTRAGEKKDDSCCNKFSQIHGVNNLFVGGLNFIPGKNASNPTLTAMCFAIKAAQDISLRLGAEKKEREKEEGEEEESEEEEGKVE
ncbi:hypothetical protein QC763_608060 [Podospora pseudopauciseta]|uniref:Pyranose 2-oxidase n=1 Tax=Podospora pseudopauciseta TaxID=2093780 RepID=A0ABR0H681_9PEZI|nr:hypothetical protein QC763_608060 [Podospora pseudopauciseta]